MAVRSPLTITPMIKNLEAFRRRAYKERWERLQRMSAEQSIAIGEALLTSEIFRAARFQHRRRPKCLAIALGIRGRHPPGRR